MLAVHTLLWRRLHGHQTLVMEAQSSLLTDEVSMRLAEVQDLQAELWRRFRSKLSKQAPGLLGQFSQLALVEAEEDHETYRALSGERDCNGVLVMLNMDLDRHKSEVQGTYGDEAA